MPSRRKLRRVSGLIPVLARGGPHDSQILGYVSKGDLPEQNALTVGDGLYVDTGSWDGGRRVFQWSEMDDDGARRP